MRLSTNELSQQRTGWSPETLFLDAKFALRALRRDAAFTCTVLIILTLGIGVTTAVFSVLDRILFRSLPYGNADRIVSVGLVQSLERQEFMPGRFYFDWQDNQKPFEALAAQGNMSRACDLIETNPAQVNCFQFGAEFLPLLGVTPIAGRNFTPDDDRPNGPKVALISYGLWKNHYGQNPAVLEHLINIDGRFTRVVGVLPKGFQLPSLDHADVVLPLVLDESVERNAMPGSPMRVFGLLKPGVSVSLARSELQPLFDQEAKWIPPDLRHDMHFSVRSLRDRQMQDIRLVAWILLGSVFAVLFIACANVASLMMARTVARERDFAIRIALGASRMRLIQQSLVEAILPSLVGALLGFVVAQGLLVTFVALAPTTIPYLTNTHLDLRVATFTILLSLLCGGVLGLCEAIGKPKAGSLMSRASRPLSNAIFRRYLVVGQIAMSVILLSAAALLLQSFRHMLKQNMGLQSSDVSIVRIALPHVSYDTGQKQMDFLLQAENAVRHLPAVSQIAWTDSIAPGGGWQDEKRYLDFKTTGNTPQASGPGDLVVWRGVTPDYFSALHIPIIMGRPFREDERTTNQGLLIISRLMALRLFPHENPIFKDVQVGANGPHYTVVGVADNVKNGGLSGDEKPECYWLRHDAPWEWNHPIPLMIVASSLPSTEVMPSIRKTVASLDPTVPVEFETLTDRISKLADQPRFETVLLAFFAGSGLIMALIGLYGVTSFMATQRTQEIGVRMALGANREDILRMIAWEGVKLSVIGCLLGLSAALVLTQILKSLLFNIGPRDPKTFAVVTLLLALVTFAASLIPARRAMKVDPMEALRSE